MLIDCDTCEARDIACEDCVVSVLLGTPQQVPTASQPYARVLGAVPPSAGPTGDGAVQLDAEEQAALQVLADFGLVPPLRLSRADPPAQDRYVV